MSTQEANASHGGGTDTAGQDRAETGGPERTEREDEPELSLDVVFEILKNERRRSVLRYLQTHADRVVLGELAEYIAAQENGTTVESLTAQQRKRVYVGLYQCHLPKMDDADVVAFDRNRGVVELGPRADELVEYLDTDADDGRNWPRYYAGLAVLGGLLFVGGEAGVYPAPWLTDVVVLAVIAAFASCAFVHDRTRQE